MQLGSGGRGPPRAGRSLSGRLFVGTSGFSYPGWVPRFYPPGTRASQFLREYAVRLPAVELNATFRRRPTPQAIRGWLAASPPGFRFIVKAQRGSAVRALLGSPADSIAWLVEPLPAFGDRLGGVLFRVPKEVRRDGPWAGRDPAAADARLAAVLGAWPSGIPLVVELQDPSWHVDETYRALTEARAILCITELPEHDTPPTVRRTGDLLYVRLRREDYTDADVAAWAARLEPFLADGLGVYAFFRHDEVGRGGELALELARLLPEYDPRQAAPAP